MTRQLRSKLRAAGEEAPEGCDDLQKIITVGLTAHREGRDPADVWEEVEREDGGAG